LPRSYRIQCRLNDREKHELEKIRDIIRFEQQRGMMLTPRHFSAEKRGYDVITDADVIRYLIKSYKHKD
jgi:hypothetical protein